MVDKSNLAYTFQEVEQEIDYTYLPDKLQYTSVSLTEVFANKLRLEASAFSIEARNAIEKLQRCKNGVSNLYPNPDFVVDAFHAPRFKRNYIKSTVPNSVGFLGSAEMLNIKPKAIKFLPKTQAVQKNLFVEKGTVLISCSGTIGKTTFVNKTLKNYSFSQHIIRLICKEYSGYVYAFLNTNEAQAQVQSLIYGAVIPEIEPHHLEKVIIPNAPESLKKVIHELIVESFDLRDQSNDLIDKAEQILYKELDLKPIEELKAEYFDNSVELRNYTTKLNDLRLRFDCSYHIPIVQLVEQEINKNSKEISSIGELSKKIILAGVFKRTYVDKENGVPFLGGRDITQLNPKVEKFLSKAVHEARIKKELEVFENYVLISDRGTIGKVQIVPKHWNGWAVSQNIIKVIANSNDLAGYLFCFLNSDYGQVLIKREIYGSVVDMIDDKNVDGIHIPLLKNEKKQKEINNLVLKANELRYQAHLKEQEAIKKMEEIINNIN
ncbi:type I restriction-modification system restriction endonuclease DNA specificity subunit HsdS [Dokdonia pacifica]|uniref:Type I restriction enzyme, S subunit n=1 Tax=Dokdonia pacifica TaxID=1627892 RepID=A0A239AGU7_9FLAO|nr:restriction endonuclease subunit S [Dokdonia pacifica]GGG37492.1 type I restriction-modification system restriction endonuclease DNA specificity subunit HsdS [Dokdonia pacifica]SNR94896.1 type I restriction enzyme, S subunit [Dokdonia pacifica]